jgi:hypothetical protein
MYMLQSYPLISLVTPWMFTKQTDGKFEKWVESGLSTFEIRRLVAEIYSSPFEISTLNCRKFPLLAKLPKRPIN